MKALKKYMAKSGMIHDEESKHTGAKNYPSHLKDDDDDILPHGDAHTVSEHGNASASYDKHSPSGLIDDCDDIMPMNSGGGYKKLMGKGKKSGGY